MSVCVRVRVFIATLMLFGISQMASGDSPPHFVHSTVSLPTKDAIYITRVDDSFEISIRADDESHPPDFEVCDPEFSPFEECYRYPREMVELTIVSGLPPGASVNQTDCVTLPIGGVDHTFCSGALITWNPQSVELSPHKIVARATSRTVIFAWKKGEWEALSIEPTTGSQVELANVNIAVTELDLANVEITQVIQVSQSPGDLQRTLDMNDGEPPVAIVTEKDVAVRIVPEQVTLDADVEVEIWSRLIEPTLEDPPLFPDAQLRRPISKECTVLNRRLRENVNSVSCQSIDFYLLAGGDELLAEGKGDLWIFLKYPESEDDPEDDPEDEPTATLVNSLDQEARIAEIRPLKCSPAPDGHDRSLDPNCILLADPAYINRFDANRFTLATKTTDEILLGAVNVCTSLDNSQCLRTPVRDLVNRISLLRKFAPTHTVSVGGTGPGARVHLGLARDDDGDKGDCYDRNGNKTLNGSFDANGRLVFDILNVLGPAAFCEADVWWYIALIKVNDAFTRSGLPRRSVGGVQSFFMGLAGEQPIHRQNRIYGIAYLNGRAGLVTASGRLLRDQEAVAHETGHLLGLTDTSIPGSTWPYRDINPPYPLLEKIVSGNPFPPDEPLKFEIGLDVQRLYDRRAPKIGSDYFDVMSYSRPRWVSPYHYDKMWQRLDPAQANLSGVSGAELSGVGVAGNFLLVSGFLQDQGAALQPLFEFEATAPIDTGTGSHRIEVLDSNGGLLFWRSFTPRESSTLMSADGQPLFGPPRFSEMIPVQAGAASIAVVDDTGTVRHSLSLGGSIPQVIILDLSGALLDGLKTVEWSVSDADSSDHVFWVEYSADAGATWSTLAQARYEPNIEVDFDALPGSNGSGLIRVLASDGVNTGSAISNLFSVAAKLPEVEILSPEAGKEYYGFAGLTLEGFGYDLDDGVLDDPGLVWESDQFGFLGTGKKLNIPEIPPGEHVITLTATDSDGNSVSDTVAFIAVAGQPTEVPTDPAPIADAGGPYLADEGDAVAFDGSASFDPEGSALVYGWDFGDGESDSGISPSHIFVHDGEFEVTLQVTDAQNLSDTDTLTARIHNVAPMVLPQADTTGDVGELLTLSASFSDPGTNDGPWEVVWAFGDGQTSSFTRSEPGDIYVDHSYSKPGRYAASMMVYDKDGGQGTGTFELVIDDILTDSDDDGVSDPDDLCPGTPVGEEVDADGCSATQLDHDGDGIADFVDNCPHDPNPGQGNMDGDEFGDVCDPTPNGETIRGDLNGDGVADDEDYQILRASLGSCEGDARFNPDADYTDDGCIDYSDLREWQNRAASPAPPVTQPAGC